MDMQWQEVEPLGPVLNGDLGGDEQVSDSWCRRFVLPAGEDGEVPVLTVSFYVALADHTKPDDRRVVLRKHYEFMRCTDPENPGDTERWCDYGYGQVPLPWQATAEDARRACAELSTPTLADWDGTQEHGDRRIVAIHTGRG